MKLITNLVATLFITLISFNVKADSPKRNFAEETMTMQRVRIDFESPNGYVRPLLLGFTTDNSATDGVDYGYDGPNFDQFPDDLFWMIENENYVIQGVGEFDNTKQYPLALFLENSGMINISLNSLENFDNDIDVYIYDSELDTYTLINESEFSIEMTEGDHIERFFIAFIDNNSDQENNGSLTVEEFSDEDTSIYYISKNHELVINSSHKISKVEVFSITGQKLFTIDQLHSEKTTIPLENSYNSYAIVKAHLNNHIENKIVMINR